MFINLLGAANTGRVIAYVMLALYIVVMVLIAYYARTKKEKGVNDFLLADRGMGGWMSAFAYGTAYFSAVIFVGYAGKLGWGFGMAVLWIGLGNALIGSYLAWKVLARRTRKMTINLNAKTMPEYFEKRYDCKYLKLVSSIIIFIFLIPYSASVYQGLGFLFELVFGIEFFWVVIIMAGITALYVFFGGYLATALTNFVQGVIMIIGVIIMVILVLNYVDWGEGIKRAAEASGGLIPSTNMSNGFVNSPIVTVISLFILTSLGIWGLPQSVHKFYAVKNRPAIKRATIVSTAFALIIGVGAYFVGAFGKVILNGQMPEGGVDAIIPEVMMITMTPVVLGLIGVLILSASMSSLSAMTLSSSSAVSVDLYKGYIKKDANDKSVKLLMRILCLVFMLLSAIFALFKVDIIITLMSLSWGTLSGCFLGPYVWGLYSKKITKTAVWTSIIACLAITFGLMTMFGFIQPDPLSTGAMAVIKGGLAKTPFIGAVTMLMSLIITPVVSLFTKKPEVEVVKLAFDNLGEI